MALIPCPHCGKEISDTAVFCEHCGKELKKEEQESTQQEVVPEIAAETMQVTPEQAEQKEEISLEYCVALQKEIRKKNMVCTALKSSAFLLLVVIAVAMSKLFSSSKNYFEDSALESLYLLTHFESERSKYIAIFVCALLLAAILEAAESFYMLCLRKYAMNKLKGHRAEYIRYYQKNKIDAKAESSFEEAIAFLEFPYLQKKFRLIDILSSILILIFGIVFMAVGIVAIKDHYDAMAEMVLGLRRIGEFPSMSNQYIIIGSFLGVLLILGIIEFIYKHKLLSKLEAKLKS